MYSFIINKVTYTFDQFNVTLLNKRIQKFNSKWVVPKLSEFKHGTMIGCHL